MTLIASNEAEIKEKLNKLARHLYMAMGYRVDERYDFSTAYHPQEHGCYIMAIHAMRFFQLEGLPKIRPRAKLDLMMGKPDPLIDALSSARERLAMKIGKNDA